MRFNDLLRTVLANGAEGPASTVTRWRQCIDLIAQYDVSGAESAHRLSEADADAVFRVLAELRPLLSVERRVASIVELGGRLRSARLCRFLSQDHPAVVSAVMMRARLVDGDWAAIIPALGPLARSILRRRSDMNTLARRALDRFGPTDLTLPPAAPTALHLRAANDASPLWSPAESVDAGAFTEEPPAHAAGRADQRADEPSEIRKIVERIERFTATRNQAADRTAPAEPAPRPPLDLALDQVVAVPPQPAVGPISAFTFETDPKGRLIDADGAPRAAVVGLSIGQPALDSLSGADGQALGACRRRAAFRDARFAIADGPLAGTWRISGEPRFDRASGHFRGYSGIARREQVHEQIIVSTHAAADRDGGLSAAGARQLIHELRTPLSAIHAYAEMIDTQLVGPVASEYREIAQRILADARELVATFDDLDLAGRIARAEDGRAPALVDVEALLRPLIQRFAQAGDHRVIVEGEGGLPFAWGDREQMDRMFTHLVRAAYAALGENEPLVIQLRHLPVTDTVSIAIRRPAALRGLSEADLLDHGSSVDQALAIASPLGLAFTLRLIRGVAGRSGGQFLLSSDAFELVLPAASQSETGQERGA